MDTCTCKYCAGPLGYLGILAGLMFFRCRDCGLMQSAQVCPDCEGTPIVDDEETGTTEYCETCYGSTGCSGLKEPAASQ